MKIIVGLGNPGPKYETTRHNVGFLAVDRLLDRWSATSFGKKNQGEVYQAQVGGESLLILKPLTYMNLSGKCVAPFYHFHRCQPEDLIVIHDELDLPPLSFRLKVGGGAGGHNGIKSIDAHVGKDHTGYFRVRVGIGHPSKIESQARVSPADYVLMPFSDQELNQLDPLLDEIGEAVELILQGQIQSAMNRFHRSK